jgi:hypothetical protein
LLLLEDLEIGIELRLRHIHAGARTALLAIVLERRADGLEGGVLYICRFVNKVEVLSARLTN